MTSSACTDGASSSPSAAWMPPWALAVLEDARPSLVASTTRAPRLGRRERGRQPGHAGADHEDVAALLGHGDRLVASSLVDVRWHAAERDGTRLAAADYGGAGPARAAPPRARRPRARVGLDRRVARAVAPRRRGRGARPRAQRAGAGGRLARGVRPRRRVLDRAARARTRGRDRPVARGPHGPAARCAPPRTSCAGSSSPRPLRHATRAAVDAVRALVRGLAAAVPLRDGGAGLLRRRHAAGTRLGRRASSSVPAASGRRSRPRCCSTPSRRRTGTTTGTSGRASECPALVVRAADGASARRGRANGRAAAAERSSPRSATPATTCTSTSPSAGARSSRTFSPASVVDDCARVWRVAESVKAALRRAA